MDEKRKNAGAKGKGKDRDGDQVDDKDLSESMRQKREKAAIKLQACERGHL